MPMQMRGPNSPARATISIVISSTPRPSSQCSLQLPDKTVWISGAARDVGGGVEARIFGGDTRFSWAAA
jgi:hypothetical protein